MVAPGQGENDRAIARTEAKIAALAARHEELLCERE